MEISLNLLFWCYPIAYSIHIIEETSVAGGFINMVKEDIWSDYSIKKFFWFNTFLYFTTVLGIILYELYHGWWILFPLSFAWMFVTNGIWHLIGSVKSRRYSPGLATSPIYWILMYWIIRYNRADPTISDLQMYISFMIGLTITVLMISSLFLGSKYLSNKE